jgi:1-acyl-sn-glycerol-3-phosphate acyltransferase
MPPLPGLKVQPIAIDYGAAAENIAWVGDEAARKNARRILSRKGRIHVRLSFLDPVDPHDVPDRKALAEAARTEIVQALGSTP